MTASGHFRRPTRVPDSSGVVHQREARSELRHFGVAPAGDSRSCGSHVKRDRPYEILPDEPTGVSRDHDRVRKAYKIVSK